MSSGTFLERRSTVWSTRSFADLVPISHGENPTGALSHKTRGLLGWCYLDRRKTPRWKGKGWPSEARQPTFQSKLHRNMLRLHKSSTHTHTHTHTHTLGISLLELVKNEKYLCYSSDEHLTSTRKECLLVRFTQHLVQMSSLGVDVNITLTPPALKLKHKLRETHTHTHVTHTHTHTHTCTHVHTHTHIHAHTKWHDPASKECIQAVFLSWWPRIQSKAWLDEVIVINSSIVLPIISSWFFDNSQCPHILQVWNQ